jgi:NADH dehydrogenase FAD-containing subunit
LPIRPLENFVVGWTRLREALGKQGRAVIAVVGGGAAGVELALAARYRLARDLGAAQVEVILVSGGELLPGYGHRVVARVARVLERQRIGVVGGYAAGTPTGLQLADGSRIVADAVIAATGVRPVEWLATSGLALAGDGFIAVAQAQQSVSHPEVFAAGDVASRIDLPHAKSGIYAVRAGPVLTTNLERVLAGLPPLAYRPQRRGLYLLATGPREAIVAWGGLTGGGHWAWRWKDWIDRRFISRYHLRPAQGSGEMHESA